MKRFLLSYIPQGIVVAGAVLIFSSHAHAVISGAPRCFDFKVMSNTSNGDVLPETETWCYERHETGSTPQWMIYEVSSSGELSDRSLVVTYDSKEQSILNLSLAFKRLGETVFKSVSDPALNPVPVPLSVLEAARKGTPHFLAQASSAEKFSAVETRFLRHYSETRSIQVETVVPGDFSQAIPNDHFPFNGFWWSQAGLTTAAGSNSPLGLFDAHQQRVTGRDPQSRLWEARNHQGSPGSWGGHCNGWAASAILYPEPTRTLYDASIQKVITPYAQKGMLAESSFCVKTAFYGHRYNGPKDDIRDIYPDLFHKVLTYYIRDLKTPVAMDYGSGADVDNHIITGYHFQISQASPSSVHVNATLTVAGYDIEQRDSIGPAHTYERKYSYTLKLNAKNEIVSGTWDASSENPDFMWVPLGAANNCGGSNPSILSNQVFDFFNQLKEPVARSIPLFKNVNETIIPQGQVDLPELLVSSGDHLKVSFNVQGLVPDQQNGAGRLMLIVSGDARYPVTGGTEESVFIPVTLGPQEVNLDRLVSIKSAALVNQSTSQAYSAKVSFTRLDYLGN